MRTISGPVVVRAPATGWPAWSHQTEASATIAPTDRSMPPPVITKVMPIETTPITEASRRMVSTLSTLANCSPAVAMPTRHRMTSATTSPRLRPTEEPSRPPAKPRALLAGAGQRFLDRGVLVGRAVVLRRLVPASRRASFHDQVEDPVLVDLGRRAGRARCVPRGRRGPGRPDRAPPPPRWTPRPRPRRGRPASGPARRSRCARRRRRRGSARRAAAPGSRAAASGPARPSAGCRRTGCAPAGPRRRAHVERLRQLVGRCAFGRRCRGSLRGRTGPGSRW